MKKKKKRRKKKKAGPPQYTLSEDKVFFDVQQN